MKRFSIICIYLFVALTGCGAPEKAMTDPEPTPETQLPYTVTEEEFRLAKSNITFVIDEFNSKWNILGTYKLDAYPDNREPYLKSRDPNYWTLPYVNIARASDVAPFDPIGTISRMGVGCLKPYEWSIKSNSGVLNLKLPEELQSCESIGSGAYSENAYYEMSEKEFQEYCRIIRGEEVQVQILGYGASRREKGAFPPPLLEGERNVCNFYIGLKLGYPYN